ncbi:hypothetical protein LOAG_05515 [Loa loa]|uniref:Uncharacterized protein n=1 Tax=Loa loa TaxID=7209 RepID=A0A1S0U1G9_LOALO|nr:hypothetical protein LOAG_05515 [Loa loa]EFO22972.2 hypothetical protein LOAG_05515 [Loa loa]
MSGFTFGTQGAASATSTAGNLFGTVPKPLFGTSTATVQTAGVGLFGAPTSLAAASTTSAGEL